MTTTTMTRSQAEEMQREASVSDSLRFFDPATGRRLAASTPGALTEQEYQAQQRQLEERRLLREQQERGRAQFASTLRAHHAREAADLERFVQCVAEHFGCPSMVDDHLRVKMRGPFLELRRLADRFNAEASRRAADPTAPTRDASGRFTKAS